MQEQGGVVKDGALVRIHYRMWSGDTLLDQTEPETPLAYRHGAAQLVPGLEAALAGRSVGEQFKVEVAPQDGYGEPAPGGPQPIPRAAFPLELELYPGLLFLGEGRAGDHLPLWVVGFDGDAVLVSANHPYAGHTLRFAVTVVSVEPAPPEAQP